MADLTPAAQAVLDAAFPVYDEDEHLYVATGEQHAGMIAAAALRAAADQVISLVLPPGKHFDVYAQGFRAARVKYRAELLALATELEAQ